MNMPLNQSKAPSSRITVVLVDDHQVVRQGTREMLCKHPQIDVVGELSSGEELVPYLTLKQPDIVLLDINLPGENGLQLLEKIRPIFPDLKIVLFSAFSDIAYLNKAQHLKANGYLSKTVDQQELHEALFNILSKSEVIYSKDLLAQIASKAESSTLLTPREQEILGEVAKGHTNVAIASKLCVSVKTVDSHVANLMKKLGVNRRTQLATFALEHGLI